MKDKLQIQKSKTDRVYKKLSVISKIPGYFSCIRDQRVLWLGHRIPLQTFDNHGHYPFRCGNILLKLNASNENHGTLVKVYALSFHRLL